ncbi:hypothetical protein [Polaromonas sp. UBA4122]|uniref:hypothetical protein n=1 Tax=Polaromonas sp. UBA4122 TaxID=1947074 RepID=UPI0039C8D066
MKKPPEGGFFASRKNYLAALAAWAAASAAAPAVEAEPAAVEAEPAASAAEPAAAEASAAGAGTTTTGAGVTTTGAASSFLPQAARATAATMAAKTSDLFIFTILDELRKQFPEIVKRKPKLKFKLYFDRGKDSSSFYPDLNYMLDITTLKTLS